MYIIIRSLNAFQAKWLKSRNLIKNRKVAPAARKKEKNEQLKPVNYTLYNQKITFDFLKAHLWSAADILRGSLILQTTGRQ